MITFKQFYNEVLIEAVNLPFAYRGRRNLYAGHTITHGDRKQQVVAKEIEFFQDINRPRGSKLIGVIGNGEGLANHIQQAVQLGFRRKDIAFFEMGPQYFQQIADVYISRELLNSEPGTMLLRYDAKQLRESGVKVIYKKQNSGDEDIVAFIPDKRNNEIPNKPSLINAFLPLDGTQLLPTLSRINKKFEEDFKDLGFTPHEIRHIDYDVTTTPNVEDDEALFRYILQQTQTSFRTYPNLQSLVQVYSWQRALPLPAEAQQRVQDNEHLRYALNYIRAEGNENMQRYDTRRLNSAINYFLRGGGGVGDALLPHLNQMLHAAGFTSLIQSYQGTGTTMLSIASVRGRNENKFSEPTADPLNQATIQKYENDIINFCQDELIPAEIRAALYDIL